MNLMGSLNWKAIKATRTAINTPSTIYYNLTEPLFRINVLGRFPAAQNHSSMADFFFKFDI